MSNDLEKLSVNSQIDDQTVVSAVIEPKAPETENIKSKPTIFAALLATLKQDKDTLDGKKGYKLPNLSYFVYSIIAVVILLAFLIVTFTFADYTVIIPVATLFAASALSYVILVFYTEFDTSNELSVFKLFLLVIFGVSLYVLTDFFCYNVLVNYIYESYINMIVKPVLITILTFVCLFVLLNFFKVKSMSACFLTAVTLVMGYSLCEIVVNNFSNMFIPMQITTDKSITTQVLINQPEFLKESFEAMIKNGLSDFVMKPYLYACWATVTAYVCSLMLDSKNTKSTMPKSVYLLLMLVVILNILAVVDTSFYFFNLALRIVSIVLSTLLLIKMLNTSLETSA